MVVTSLYRSALVATGRPPFGRSFTPPPLRYGSVHSLPLSGRPSAPTATPSRSRRVGASCRRGAGIPARASASLAGLLPYIPAGFLPAFGNGAWVPRLPAPVPRPPRSGTAPARFRKLHLAGLRRPAPGTGLGRGPGVVGRRPPAPRQPSPGSRLRKLRRHPSGVRHSAPAMGAAPGLPPSVPRRSAPLASVRAAPLARSLRFGRLRWPARCGPGRPWQTGQVSIPARGLAPGMLHGKGHIPAIAVRKSGASRTGLILVAAFQGKSVPHSLGAIMATAGHLWQTFAAPALALSLPDWHGRFRSASLAGKPRWRFAHCSHWRGCALHPFWL